MLMDSGVVVVRKGRIRLQSHKRLKKKGGVSELQLKAEGFDGML